MMKSSQISYFYLGLRVVIYLVTAFILFSLYSFFFYTRPKRYVSTVDPSDLGFAYQDLTLKTKDNISLAGWFIPNKDSFKAVVVCHGYPMDKGDVLEIAQFLAKDYNLFLFDFRAMGRSEGKFSTVGWKEREDFLSAVEFLRRKGFKDIGAIGFSMGAAVILMSESPDIKCIVSDSSYAVLEPIAEHLFKNFAIFQRPLAKAVKFLTVLFLGVDIAKVSPVNYISRINAPVLLIHSKQDEEIPVEHVYRLHDANRKSKIWVLPEGHHIQGFMAQQKEYMRKVSEFFKDNL
jgi:dipeptidyl aminopeptidase/acylaminoacyl peptidase